jgi:outer membrane protein assembly factor BamB
LRNSRVLFNKKCRTEKAEEKMLKQVQHDRTEMIVSTAAPRNDREKKMLKQVQYDTLPARHKKLKSKLASAALYMFFLAVISICLLLIMSSPSESSPTPGIMPISEVREGMRGYGLTVYKGTKIERFPIEVIGKLETYVGESDLILIRVLGGYTVDQGIGVIAGMSGSPIYINDRLIGAIGYGWSFSKEPIGGVTPIEHMLREFTGTKADNSRPQKLSAREYNLNRSLTVDGTTFNRIIVDEKYIPANEKTPQGTMVMSPLSAMVQVSGFSQASMRLMREELEPYGIIPIAAPGANRRTPPQNFKIEPGAAIGVTFVDGDLYMGGVGTVTYRRGDSILAFGHPMMQLGTTNLPLNAAYIEGIIPSMLVPFKMASSMGIVGTLRQDRLYAIAGELGPKPKMIPVKIEVIDTERNIRKNFNLRVLEQKYLTPLIMSFSGYESISSSATSLNDTSAHITYEMEIEGYPGISFEDYVAGRNIQEDTGRQIRSYLTELAHPGFEMPKISKLSMKIKIAPQNNSVFIKDISTQYRGVRPGDNVPVSVRMKTVDNQTITQEFKVPIPSDVERGNIKIIAASGRSIDQVRKRLRLQPNEPENFKQVVDRMQKRERNNELVIQAIYPRQTISFAGETINNLPRSKQLVFMSSPRSIVSQTPDSYVTRLRLPYNIEGFGDIDITLSGNVPSSQDSFSQSGGSSETNINTPVDATGSSFSFPAVSPTGRTSSRSMNLLRLMQSDIPAVSVDMNILSSAASAAAKKTPEKKDDKKTDTPTGSSVITLSTAQDYFSGTFENTSITNGNIMLGYKTQPMYESGQSFIMDVHHDSLTGKTYAVESPTGYLIELKDRGKPAIIGKTGESLVPCMTMDKAGNIYVGTGTSGRIYKKPANGALQLFCTLQDEVVWDLKVEPSGNILAATGNEGKIYRITPDGNAKVFFNPPELHVTALELTPDGTVFAGCSNEGNIYKITPDGRSTSFYRTLGQSVEALLYDKGTLWIAADELLYRIGENNQRMVYLFPESTVLSLSKDQNGSIFAGTSNLGRVYRFNGENFENLFEADINQVMNIAMLGNGEMLLATGNPGKVIRVGNYYNSEGRYFSRVMDLGNVSDFGRLQWKADTPKGTEIRLQTRSGNTASPDNTWSSWSHEYSMDEGQLVVSPSARYIQVRARLVSDEPVRTPVLYNIALYYRHQSIAPLMELEEPKAGAKLSGIVDVKWKAFATNPQFLTFSLFYSEDSGTTWKAIKENIDAKHPKAPANKVNEIIKDTHKWATRQLKSGTYLIKLRGFDRTQADNEKLAREIISKPVVICNQKPDITIMETVVEENRVLIQGFVKTGSTNIKEVTYKIDKDDWKHAFPEDGIFDNNRKRFTIFLNKPYPKNFKLEVKAVDEAGNSAELSRNMKI